MRSDMHKIIVERPRHGRSFAKVLKGTQRRARTRGRHGDPENLPFIERIERTKGLSENLSPLHRFFRKSVGRPWNKVHSKLSKIAGRGTNPVNNHIFQHIEQLVPREVVLRDDGPYLRNHWGRPRKLRPGELYVHPDTGLISVVKNKVQTPPEDKRSFVPISDTDYAIKLDGIWFRFGMATYDEVQVRDARKAYVMKDGWPVGAERTYVEVRDAHLGYQPLLSRLRGFYNMKWWRSDARVYAASKRALEPAELKKLGLKNAAADQG